MNGAGLWHAGRAFARTRWLAARLRTTDDVRRHRDRQLARMMREVIPGCAYYRDLGITRFDALPIMDKAAVLANFPALNQGGLTVEAVRAAIERGDEKLGGYAFGRSTGTSGNRGYFVISDRERFVWLGTILAKTLPDALWTRHRVALALPGLSTLYQSASGGSRVQLAFFDLALGVDAWADRLAAFAPDTIVAPPKVLRLLAERGQLPARHIFSGAEVLDPIDQAIIEAATGRTVRQIYMATEGLLGVSCPHGTLHLAEDAVAFEWERPSADSPLVTPIITDFTRRAQVMARYRMNDLIELDDAPCGCGSPLQPVKRIEGRQDDVFLMAARDGTLRMVTPDILRNAVIDSDPAIDDFRIVQTGASEIEVALVETIDAGPIVAALTALADRLGLAPVSVSVTRELDIPFDRKLRRVRRAWSPI